MKDRRRATKRRAASAARSRGQEKRRVFLTKTRIGDLLRRCSLAAQEIQDRRIPGLEDAYRLLELDFPHVLGVFLAQECKFSEEYAVEEKRRAEEIRANLGDFGLGESS